MENAGVIFGAIAAVSALGLVTAASPCRADSYVFDQRHSEVRFGYTMGMAQQKGRFTRIHGAMEFDDSSPERGHVDAIIETASLVTGESLVEEELKSSDFFNAAIQTEIRFKSRAIRMTGPDTAEMTGEITINGVTKPVTLQVGLRPYENPALKYEVGAREFVATTRIKRSAFNMTAYASMVGDAVDIEIDAILRKQR